MPPGPTKACFWAGLSTGALGRLFRGLVMGWGPLSRVSCWGHGFQAFLGSHSEGDLDEVLLFPEPVSLRHTRG